MILPLIYCDDWQTLHIMEQWENAAISPAASNLIELAWQKDIKLSRFEAEQIIGTYYNLYFNS